MCDIALRKCYSVLYLDVICIFSTASHRIPSFCIALTESGEFQFVVCHHRPVIALPLSISYSWKHEHTYWSVNGTDTTRNQTHNIYKISSNKKKHEYHRLNNIGKQYDIVFIFLSSSEATIGMPSTIVMIIWVTKCSDIFHFVSTLLIWDIFRQKSLFLSHHIVIKKNEPPENNIINLSA